MSTALALPMFNPIVFAKRLKDAGVPEQQADAEAEILHDALAQQAQAMSAQASAQVQAVSVLESKFVTLESSAKHDAKQMATTGDVRLVKEELTAEIALVRAEIELVKEELAAEIGLVRAEIERINATLTGQIASVRQEIAIARRDAIIWLGGMLIFGFGSVMTMLFRLLK